MSQGCTLEHCPSLACLLQTAAAGARPQTIRNLAATLVPGLGRVYLRDYGRGDLAGERLHRAGRARRLERGAYCRSDGTRTYFFSEVRSRVGKPATFAGVSCCGLQQVCPADSSWTVFVPHIRSLYHVAAHLNHSCKCRAMFLPDAAVAKAGVVRHLPLARGLLEQP